MNPEPNISEEYKKKSEELDKAFEKLSPLFPLITELELNERLKEKEILESTNKHNKG